LVFFIRAGHKEVKKMVKGAPLGYNGKTLRVNLSNKSTTIEEISEKLCKRYIGGIGFIIYYLWKELKQGVDALSIDNKLIFALGPVSGIRVPGAARNCIGAKSPMTGGIGKAEAGGYWGAELKRAGFDIIIVEGKAEKPVYLWIQDGKVNIRDASHLWGKETKETEAAVRDELGDDRVQLAMIGLAGEHMVRYACIMNGCHDAAARSGLGAVMGSKNLKAIAVRGHNAPKIADPECVKEIRQKMIAEPHWLSEFGTGGPELEMQETLGDLPIRNFRDGLFPEVNQINGAVMKETMGNPMEGCYACPVRCKKMLQFKEPYTVDAIYGGPEYESIAALGSNCGVTDVKAIVKANERCNAYAMDTISTGSSIAFAMECFERGLLTTKDSDGFELKFGDGEAVLKAIDLIARRQGVGNLLAEGTARMAKKIGKGSEAFAMNVKGLEAGMHEPRLNAGLGLSYMVSSYGADHASTVVDFFYLPGPEPEVAMAPLAEGLLSLGIESIAPPEIGPRKVAYTRLAQIKGLIEDSMVVCIFLAYNVETMCTLYTAATGLPMGANELIRAAERTMTLERLFNIREGFSAADDVLPERYYQPTTNGALSNNPLDRAAFEKARLYYYTLMGWDAKGVPLPEKVEELRIE
jgi:aldehyde:ferredoxin oxidoreductase